MVLVVVVQALDAAALPGFLGETFGWPFAVVATGGGAAGLPAGLCAVRVAPGLAVVPGLAVAPGLL